MTRSLLSCPQRLNRSVSPLSQVWPVWKGRKYLAQIEWILLRRWRRRLICFVDMKRQQESFKLYYWSMLQGWHTAGDARTLTHPSSLSLSLSPCEPCVHSISKCRASHNFRDKMCALPSPDCGLTCPIRASLTTVSSLTLGRNSVNESLNCACVTEPLEVGAASHGRWVLLEDLPVFNHGNRTDISSKYGCQWRPLLLLTHRM